jgi:hypothetical protein
MQQAGLAHPHIPDDDIFEDVGVVVRARRHLALFQLLQKTNRQKNKREKLEVEYE